MISHTGQKIVTIHTLSNISRSKNKTTIKSDQLIEYNIRYIFLKKAYTKCGGRVSPRPFEKKLKLGISLHQQSEML